MVNMTFKMKFQRDKFNSEINCWSNYYNFIKLESQQFCTNTALHGYKFITKKDESVFLRFFWAIIIFVSFAIAIFLMCMSYQNLSENLVDFVADSVHYPIWQYDFPAVTICNFNKVSFNRTNKFMKEIKNPNNFDKQYIIFLLKHLSSIFLFISYDHKNIPYYKDLQILLDANNLTAQDVMMQIRPRCKDILHSCSLKGRLWRCDSLFEEISTIEGLCCSSNYYALKNKYFSGYYSDRYKKNPRRMSACGHHTGYKILINNHPEDYLFTTSSAYGTKVIIHDAYDYPGWTVSSEVAGMSEEKFIGVSPFTSYATNAVVALRIPQRKCLFQGEKELKYFKYYSEINCLTECRVDLIRKKCGCVPMFFWNLNFNESNKLKSMSCNISTAQCVSSLSLSMVTFFPGYEYNGEKAFNYLEAENNSVCNCLPSCEYRQYDIETSKTILSRKHAKNFKQFFNNINVDNHSVVSVYFKDLIASRNKKDLTINWYSELAWFGGLIGLCIGFSFTSGFEIIYYLTIRFFVNYYIYKTENKRKQTTKVSPIFYINNFNRAMPPINKLFNLKKTNNPWYIE